MLNISLRLLLWHSVPPHHHHHQEEAAHHFSKTPVDRLWQGVPPHHHDHHHLDHDQEQAAHHLSKAPVDRLWQGVCPRHHQQVPRQRGPVHVQHSASEVMLRGFGLEEDEQQQRLEQEFM